MPQSNSPYFEFLHSTLGEGLVGVEIGIWDGGNAEAVLGHIKPSKYYMIDPYRASKEYVGPQFSQEEFDKMHNIMCTLFGRFPNVVILKMTALEASEIIENDLDFVYIDGSHTYENKMLDLRTWYPKVRAGGVIGGDDYVIPSVIKAVNDFEEEMGIKFEIANYTPPHPPEYWTIKKG